ncbi:hypothetical protein ACHAPU_008070 [Fusarium lateritium]
MTLIKTCTDPNVPLRRRRTHNEAQGHSIEAEEQYSPVAMPSSSAQLPIPSPADEQESESDEYVHPVDEFSMLRFSVALPPAVKTDGDAECDGDGDGDYDQCQVQPVELCFHHSFRSRPDVALSLHFDDNRLSLVHPPPPVSGPRPPGVIIDCGRVELFEQRKRHGQNDSHVATDYPQIPHATDQDAPTRKNRHRDVIALVAATTLLILLSSWLRSTPVAPVILTTDTIHLDELVINFTRRAHYVPISLFFLADPTETPEPGSLNASDQGFGPSRLAVVALARELAMNTYGDITDAIWHHEKALFDSSDRGYDATKRYMDRSQWAVGNLTLHEIDSVYNLVDKHASMVSSAWSDMASIPIEWLSDAVSRMFRIANALNSTKVETNDALFHPREQTGTDSIQVLPLPNKLSPAAARVLKQYRNYYQDPEWLTQSCSFFAACSKLAALDRHRLHPACLTISSDPTLARRDRVAALSNHFQSWAQDETDANQVGSRLLLPDHPAPRLVLEHACHAMRLSVAASKLANLARRANVFIPTAQSIEGNWKGMLRMWQGKAPPTQRETAAQGLANLVDTLLAAQTNATIDVLFDIHDACIELSTMYRLLDDLADIKSWIQNVNGTQVVKRMPHPADQAQLLFDQARFFRAQRWDIKEALQAWQDWDRSNGNDAERFVEDVMRKRRETEG